MSNNKNGYVISVIIALLVASIMLGAYLVWLQPKREGYLTLYVLDAQKKAIDYPERLVNGINSTFSVYVDVENHLGNETKCEVQVKVIQDMNPTFPVGVNPTLNFSDNIKNGAIWENVTTIQLDKAGSYSIIFELYTITQSEEREFSGQFVALNVQVVD